jgi:ARC6-like, IMS domain
MQPEPFLIEKLNTKIAWLKANNQSFFRADGTFAGEDGNRLLQEYDQIKDNPRVPKPLRYTVLSVIAKEYNLYENDQEPNRVSHETIDAIEESFTRSGNGGVEGIIIGLQILRNQYPLSYAASEPGLASIESICMQKIATAPQTTPVVEKLPVTPLNTVHSQTAIPETEVFRSSTDEPASQTQTTEHSIIIPKKVAWRLGLVLLGVTGLTMGTAFGLWKANDMQVTTNLQPSSLPVQSSTNTSVDIPSTAPSIAQAASTSPQPVNITSTISPSPSNPTINYTPQAPANTRAQTFPSVVAERNTNYEDDAPSEELIVPVRRSANISQADAIGLVEKLLQSKSALFGPPYNQDLGGEIMTGKAYRDNIRGPSSDGTGESSIEWLRNNGHYYSYGVQQIQRVNYFTAANNNAVMELKILEDANLYDSRGKLNKSKSGLEEKIIRYSFVLENGQLKISDYNIISKSKRKF